MGGGNTLPCGTTVPGGSGGGGGGGGIMFRPGQSGCFRRPNRARFAVGSRSFSLSPHAPHRLSNQRKLVEPFRSTSTYTLCSRRSSQLSRSGRISTAFCSPRRLRGDFSIPLFPLARCVAPFSSIQPHLSEVQVPLVGTSWHFAGAFSLATSLHDLCSAMSLSSEAASSSSAPRHQTAAKSARHPQRAAAAAGSNEGPLPRHAWSRMQSTTRSRGRCSFVESNFSQGDWRVPLNYDYTRSTSENYGVKERLHVGPYHRVRASRDHSYHGTYTRERQLFQGE